MAEDAKVITLQDTGSVGSPQWKIEGTATDASELVSKLNSAFNTTLTCAGMGGKIKVVIVTPGS